MYLFALCVLAILLVLVLCNDSPVVQVVTVGAIGLGYWALKKHLLPSLDIEDDDSSEGLKIGQYEGGAVAKKAKKTKAEPKKAAKKDASKKVKGEKNKKLMVFSGVLPVSKDGKKVLIVKTKKGQYSFIRGHMADGHTAAKVAAEACKNVGFDVKEKDLKDAKYVMHEYSFEVSEESYQHHLKRAEKRGIKPTITSPGLVEREQMYYILEMDEKEPKVDTNVLSEAKWVSWDEAMKLMSESKQLDVLKKAKDAK